MHLSFFTFALCLQEIWGMCYFPNGDNSPRAVPCHENAIESFCCAPHQGCLSNKLCFVNPTETDPANFVYARGSCTDKTWKSGACADFCLGSSLTHPLSSSVARYAVHGLIILVYRCGYRKWKSCVFLQQQHQQRLLLQRWVQMLIFQRGHYREF